MFFFLSMNEFMPRGTHRQIPVHDAGGRGVKSCVNQIFSGTCNVC